jgi:hypothetical protein
MWAEKELTFVCTQSLCRTDYRTWHTAANHREIAFASPVRRQNEGELMRPALRFHNRLLTGISMCGRAAGHIPLV